MPFDPGTQDDSQALVRHFAPGKVSTRPRTWGEGGEFDPGEGEAIYLAGGAPVYEMQAHGFFETRLQRAFPTRGLKVRNLGWAADTVFRQQRPMFFFTEVGDTREGSVPDQRKRLEPGILVLRFGKLESLEGESGRSEFQQAYAALLDALAPISERIVLVAPEPFFAVGPAAHLAEERNEVLASYREAIRDLAEDRDLRFVDLYQPLLEGAAVDLSRTGIDLTPEGQREVARLLAEQLGFGGEARLEGEEVEALRQAILRKNQLWHQYYRPTNWAFLFGDRQHVPSSRDHRDANRRWFVEELEKLPGLIAVSESEMAGLANRDR